MQFNYPGINSPTVSGLQYRTSTTAEWTNYNINNVIELKKKNDIIQFKNLNTELGNYISSTFSYVQFILTGQIKAKRKCIIIT